MAFVKVPREYFQKSKLEYSDWKWAFIRELIQNSYDAGADQIDFEFAVDTRDGSNIITCIDNGCGMDRNILENVLLCLGGSFKANGSIGGFGYAKSILFFTHDKYTIETRDWIVEGVGGEYEIRKSATYVRGTSIEVIMRETALGGDLACALKEYCAYMSTERQVCITLNGSTVKSNYTEFDFITPTKLGRLLFKEVNSNSSRLVVSVRGLPMFIHLSYHGSSLGTAYNGLLELQGESYDLLTANRDALKGQYGQELTNILTGMLENRAILKQGRTVNVMFNLDDLTKQKLSQSNVIGQSALFKRLTTETGKSQPEENFDPIRNDYYPTNFPLRICNYGSKYVENSDKTTLKEVISLMKKTAVKRIAWEWKRCVYSILASGAYNTSFYIRGHEVETVGSSVKYEVDFMLDGDFFYKDRRVVAGFIISKTLEGLNVFPEYGDIQILVNPSMFFKEDYTYDVDDLMDVAQHECAHLKVNGHGEDFCNVEIESRRKWRRLYDKTQLLEVKKLGKKKTVKPKKTPLRKKTV